MGCPKRNGQPLIALRKIPNRTHIFVVVVLVVVVPVPIVEIEVVCVIIVGSVLGRRPDNADYVCSVIRMYNRIRLPKKRHLLVMQNFCIFCFGQSAAFTQKHCHAP